MYVISISLRLLSLVVSKLNYCALLMKKTALNLISTTENNGWFWRGSSNSGQLSWLQTHTLIWRPSHPPIKTLRPSYEHKIWPPTTTFTLVAAWWKYDIGINPNVSFAWQLCRSPGFCYYWCKWKMKIFMKAHWIIYILSICFLYLTTLERETWSVFKCRGRTLILKFMQTTGNVLCHWGQ